MRWHSRARLTRQYLLKTADEEPAHIAISTSGWRDGPADVLAALRDPERASAVDPSTYTFRCVKAFELTLTLPAGECSSKLATSAMRF